MKVRPPDRCSNDENKYDVDHLKCINESSRNRGIGIYLNGNKNREKA